MTSHPERISDCSQGVWCGRVAGEVKQSTLSTPLLVPQKVNMWLLITAQPRLLNPNILNTVAR